jgi:hypothetical protein
MKVREEDCAAGANVPEFLKGKLCSFDLGSLWEVQKYFLNPNYP